MGYRSQVETLVITHIFSRGAATDNSLGRKPQVERPKTTKPRRGDNEDAGCVTCRPFGFVCVLMPRFRGFTPPLLYVVPMGLKKRG